MLDGDALAALVMRAREGDQEAWNALVERFAPLVYRICRRFRLPDADLLDVGQTVWLAVLEHLDQIRETQALPGWIATTTRRECLQVVGGRQARQRQELVGVFDTPSGDLADDVADLLLNEQRRAALRAALRSLPPQHQQLLILLVHEPPLTYAEIGRRLRIAVGTIGPTRGRCIEKLKAHPAVRALMEPGAPARTREVGRPS